MTNPSDSPKTTFIRVPTPVFETLLRLQISGVQWRLVLWVIRNTLGWNRPWTTFSWYRIGKHLSADRRGVARAGAHLIKAGVLTTVNNSIGLAAMQTGDDRPPAGTNDPGVKGTRFRGQASPFYRRAKERSKETKTKNSGPQARHHPAGAAEPVPGKYRHLGSGGD